MNIIIIQVRIGKYGHSYCFLGSSGTLEGCNGEFMEFYKDHKQEGRNILGNPILLVSLAWPEIVLPNHKHFH